MYAYITTTVDAVIKGSNIGINPCDDQVSVNLLSTHKLEYVYI